MHYTCNHMRGGRLMADPISPAPPPDANPYHPAAEKATRESPSGGAREIGTTRTARLRRNILSTYAAHAVTLVAGVILFPFVARTLNLEVFGLWLLVTSTGSLIAVDFGLGTSVTRYVADARARGDAATLSQTVVTAMAFFLLLAVACGVVLGGVMTAAWGGLQVSHDQVPAVRAMVLTYIASTLFLGFQAGVLRNVLVGAQRSDLGNAVLIIQVLGRFAVTVALLVAGLGIGAVLIAEGLTAVVAFSGYLLLCRRLVPELSLSPRHASVRTLARMAPYSAQVFVLSLAAVAVLQTDNLIIGLLLPVSMIAIYGAGFRLYQFCRLLTNALTGPLIPDASEAIAWGDHERLRRTLLRGTAYSNGLVFFIGPPLAVLAEPLLHLWVGADFAAAAPVTQLLVASMLLNNNHLVALSLATGTGRLRPFVWLHLAWAASNVVLSIALAPRLGIVGVALGTAMPLVVLEPLYLRFALRQFGVRPAEFLVQAVVPAVASAALASVPLGVVARLAPAGLVGMLVAGAAYGLVYCVAFWRFGVAAGDRAALIRIARRRTVGPVTE